MPVLLLLLFSVALSIGMGIIILVIRRAQQKPNALAPRRPIRPVTNCSFERLCLFRRPACWLAIKSRNQTAVQTALGLHNAKPCSWVEGMACDEKLFVSPPVKGWILVVGAALPDPSDDVDACFRFVQYLSRKLGKVQFFSVNRVLHYHSWIRVEGSKVVRAYAWAGKTLWNQGALSAPEKELDLKCFDYCEAAEVAGFGQPDVLALNVDKVPLLAARWSLDPARIEERFLEHDCGIVGEPSHRY